jgi:mRNA interferase MazF
VGRRNGLGQASVISCDNVVTVPEAALGPQIGYLLPAQEAALTNAVHAALISTDTRRPASKKGWLPSPAKA